MSRRDEVVESLGDALTNIRRELTAALASPSTSTTNISNNINDNTHSRASNSTPSAPPSSVRRLSSALASFLDPGPTNPARAGQGQVQASGSSVKLHARPSEQPGPSDTASGRLTQVPFGAETHHTVPLRDEQGQGYSTLPSSALAARRLSVDGPADEELPSYSRRPIDSPRPANLPPLTLHVFTSKTGKLEMSLCARGDQHAILIQEDVEADVPVEGTLLVSLPTAEVISFIKIRVKCAVRTMVMRVNGSTRHPVVEERILWEDQQLLWEQTGDTFLATNESPDPAKLQGKFEFPFTLTIPGRLPNVSDPSSPITPRTRAPPPSFVLSSAAAPTPDSTGLLKGGEWASARYYVKVTLARKGLLKINERFITPVIYVPRHQEPAMSPARTAALAAGRPTPGPLEDPSGWSAQKVRHTVKRGVWNGKKAWYEVVLMLPLPLRFARLSVVPFAIKLRSSDPNTTSRFPLSSVTAVLIQRSYISAQGMLNTHDLALGEGKLMDDGAPEGVPLRPSGPDSESDAAVWERSLRGSFELSKRVGSSFKSPTLAVQFLVAVYVTVPGPGNDAEVATIIEIVSAAPTYRPTQVRPSVSGPIAIAAAGVAGEAATGPAAFSPEDTLGLPPTYFSVIESSQR